MWGMPSPKLTFGHLGKKWPSNRVLPVGHHLVDDGVRRWHDDAAVDLGDRFRLRGERGDQIVHEDNEDGLHLLDGALVLADRELERLRSERAGEAGDSVVAQGDVPNQADLLDQLRSVRQDGDRAVHDVQHDHAEAPDLGLELARSHFGSFELGLSLAAAKDFFTIQHKITKCN